MLLFTTGLLFQATSVLQLTLLLLDRPIQFRRVPSPLTLQKTTMLLYL